MEGICLITIRGDRIRPATSHSSDPVFVTESSTKPISALRIEMLGLQTDSAAPVPASLDPRLLHPGPQ